MADPDNVHFLGIAGFHLGLELLIGDFRGEAVRKRALFDGPGDRFRRAVEGQHVVRPGWSDRGLCVPGASVSAMGSDGRGAGGVGLASPRP